MKGVCIRETSSTEGIILLNEKDELLETFSKQKTPINMPQVLSQNHIHKQKHILTAMGTMEVRSNLIQRSNESAFPQKKYQFKINKSIVVRPKTLSFPRVSSVQSFQENKNWSFKKSISCKRSNQLKKILKGYHQTNKQQKTGSNKRQSFFMDEIHKLQKLTKQSIFIQPNPIHQKYEPKEQQDQSKDLMKLLSINRYDSWKICQKNKKKVLPLRVVKEKS